MSDEFRFQANVHPHRQHETLVCRLEIYDEGPVKAGALSSTSWRLILDRIRCLFFLLGLGRIEVEWDLIDPPKQGRGGGP